MYRKDFLKKCCLFAGGITVSHFLTTGCSAANLIPHTTDGFNLKVLKADLEGLQFAIVRPKSLKVPVYLTKNGDGYIALLMECTHQRCEISPLGQELHCPCHGSAFNCRGEVLEGPAEKPLRRFQVDEDGDYLLIR